MRQAGTSLGRNCDPRSSSSGMHPALGQAGRRSLRVRIDAVWVRGPCLCTVSPRDGSRPDFGRLHDAEHHELLRFRLRHHLQRHRRSVRAAALHHARRESKPSTARSRRLLAGKRLASSREAFRSSRDTRPSFRRSASRSTVATCGRPVLRQHILERVRMHFQMRVDP